MCQRSKGGMPNAFNSLSLSVVEKQKCGNIVDSSRERSGVFLQAVQSKYFETTPNRQKSGEQEKYGTIVKTISILESWLARFSLIYFLSYESILVKACAVK